MVPRLRPAFLALTVVASALSCTMDRAPSGLRRTPPGPGATIRYDLGHRPLPDIPLPIDTATWADPTSRTGLRINASLVAPTSIEAQARGRFSQMEGWGTFAPISVSFDLKKDPTEQPPRAALDLENVKKRHQLDDYDFADDAIYVVNLSTGVPHVVDIGAKNFDYTLKKLDKYWPNDTRVTERNLLFETIDESLGGKIDARSFGPEYDTDFDGTLDVPNLDDPGSCPDPDRICDDARNEAYGSPACTEKRRARDRCMADHLLTWYERETDTLILRPLLPMDEMTRYAVIITDRTLDSRGNAVRSPFDFVYHAAQESTAKRVRDIIDDQRLASYFGDIAGTGLDHVAFTWSFTTQPTVDDMKKLRDGLYGKGPFARWEKDYPPELELQRAVGLNAGLSSGSSDPPGWKKSSQAEVAGCGPQVGNLYTVKYDAIRDGIREFILGGFGFDEGPGAENLLREFENIDHMVVGSFRTPFLLEGGPKSTDPNAAFDLNFTTGKGYESSDVVQFWLVVPKETKEFKQPFDVNVYGHGYTGNFTELLLYAGGMARHGLATIGINAMGHGLTFSDPLEVLGAKSTLMGMCIGPFYDALTTTRARDLNSDGVPDSGGDFWSSYLFHTRDGVRQSTLDHIQLVRILRSFGSNDGRMLCRTEGTGWAKTASKECDVDADGKAEVIGDFDGDGRPDVGGPKAKYGTWGESLGGILSAIHGAVDPHVTTAVPGSGGGGLTDIGIRSFQGGVVEAVLLRLWGPLLVTVPVSAVPHTSPVALDPPACTASNDDERCTVCKQGQISLRWVVPDLNDTAEIEIDCLSPDEVKDTTVLVTNLSNGELRCASPDDEGRMRIGLPSSVGDRIELDFLEGKHDVRDYASCAPREGAPAAKVKRTITQWGKGRFAKGTPNLVDDDTCGSKTCTRFQGWFFGEGSDLVAPAEGYGEIRQTPALRRFMQLAQAALEPGDPVSFAPFYSIRQMNDPSGHPIEPHALLTLNTIGDMNVPLNAGIAFARASGALPFFRPDQVAKYPHYANYATPFGLYETFGKTPNQLLIDTHVVEGIAALARHPADPACAASANAKPADGTFTTREGEVLACYPEGCTEETEADPLTRLCYYDTTCNPTTNRCEPNLLDPVRCQEALFDVDDLDEGTSLYQEQRAVTPLRIARYTRRATPSSLDSVWAPRLRGRPYSADGGWQPDPAMPLTALIDAYVVPDGVHTFTNGEPCQSFDAGSYLTNLTARFFMSNGTDLYYLSHPKSHLCLGRDVTDCAYMKR
jgi:hypothetical protein